MGYISLKDLYANTVQGAPVPVEPRRAIRLTEQDNVAALLPTDVSRMKTLFDSAHEEKWPASVAGVPFKTANFKAVVGEGNGERKVAALFHAKIKGETDKDYTARLAEFIAGQNESFDVMSDQGNFEVKEFKLTKKGTYSGSVRIGAEGRHTTGIILTRVKEILITLQQLYSSLDDDSKKVLNKSLIETIKTTNTVPANWTLENYIDAIFDVTIGEERGITEFPKTLFNAEKINPNSFVKNIKRATYLVYTIPQILNAFNILARDKNADLEGEISRVKQLQNTLKGLYLKKEDEKFGKEIEQEAERLDRKLISKACAVDKGANCISLGLFLQKIVQLNLPTIFSEIDMLRASEVANLFPPSIKGFFAVFETKYKYIPRNQLGQYLYIDSFTQKGLKIALRQA